ncbi:MAG: radical SAM family heme chaperone HemW, partial [Rhodospirillales bacterium]|nr:radical SAM family heme chaperone HemW [Rhodospirillales bacterium]
MAEPLSLYVHWPFCAAKCPYCDFNSHTADSIQHDRWRKAFLSGLERYRNEIGERPVSTIFFGGGTPSLMAPDTVGAIIEKTNDLFALSDDIEVTLEANPGTVDAARFHDFHAAGVNRLSLGVQSFDDGALRFLGRIHSAEESRVAIERAQAVFPRVSFDLIYALPGQDESGWRRELTSALAFSPEHISVYQLTVEHGTAFYNDRVPEADEDLGERLYAATQDVLSEAGLPAYEISNHAQPNAACRHNLSIWRGGDYIGLGPGAHGRLNANGATMATHEVPKPDGWLGAMEESGDARVRAERLSPLERAEELLLLGLRLNEGVERTRFHAACGVELDAVIDAQAR